MSAGIRSIHALLRMDLRIPSYQRPYRWTTKNISDLLGDIEHAMSDASKYPGCKYRVGTVILHHNKAQDCYDIVDGQQRLLSLTLLALCLNPDISFPMLDNSSFSSRETQRNIEANYAFIADWLGYQSDDWRKSALDAFDETLEAVVITVDRVEEAFQLFDSQNTRGRSLDPHDLLKAYHLRAMRDWPYEMRHVVTRWESFSADEIRDIFARYLFPCLSWEMKEKARPFTAKEIDAYKGIDDGRGYAYASRARRAAPSFQIGAPFIEGEDFFLMAEHYLSMRADIELELRSNPDFRPMQAWLDRKNASAGLKHAQSLFMCALFAYYDRFHNFDERAVRKLFAWAFMVRVDMTSLGFDTINKYALGEDNDRYTNVVPMFALIARARYHTQIADVRILTTPKGRLDNASVERHELVNFLESWQNGGAR